MRWEISRDEIFSLGTIGGIGLLLVIALAIFISNRRPGGDRYG